MRNIVYVCIAAVVAAAYLVGAQESGNTTTTTEPILDTQNKTQCVALMVSWCKDMQFPQQGAGMAMLSVTYEDRSGYYRVYCNSDSEAINCTRNGKEWFVCTSNNTLFYKGKILQNTDSSTVDDDICGTADAAFDELFVQNLSYDNDNTTLKTEVEKGMESFFEQMAEMQEQIELIRRALREAFWYIGGLNTNNNLP